jgi:hypothetical protein
MNIKKYLILLMFFTNLIYSNIKTEGSSFVISAILNIISKELTKKNADENLTFSTEEELKNFYSLIDSYLPQDDQSILKSKSTVAKYKKNFTNIYNYYLPVLALDLFSSIILKPKNPITIIGKVAWNLDAIAKVTSPDLSFQNSLSQLTKKLYPDSEFMQDYIKTIFKKNNEKEKIEFLSKNKTFFGLLKKLYNKIKEIEEIIDTHSGINLEEIKEDINKKKFASFFNAKTNNDEQILKKKINELEKERSSLTKLLSKEEIIEYNKNYIYLKNKIASLEKKKIFDTFLLKELKNSIPKIRTEINLQNEITKNDALKKAKNSLTLLETIARKHNEINEKKELLFNILINKKIEISPVMLDKEFLLPTINNLYYFENNYKNFEEIYNNYIKKLDEIIKNPSKFLLNKKS